MDKTLRLPKMPKYTGEGFKGERLLSIGALLLTVFSTMLLIDLTLKQRKHIDMQMKQLNKKNGTNN